MSPEEILVLLKSQTSVRRHKSLDAIYGVCEDQVKRGVTDFSYTTIAQLGAKRGVPKAQSIRNKTGEQYRVLIKSFNDSSKNVKAIRKPTKADGWIDDIHDVKLKLLVAIQASELKEARRMLKEIIPPGTEIIVDDRSSNLSQHQLSELERDALEYILSEDFFKEWALSVGRRGDIIDSNGSKIFKVATIDAIKKALRFL